MMLVCEGGGGLGKADAGEGWDRRVVTLLLKEDEMAGWLRIAFACQPRTGPHSLPVVTRRGPLW